MIFLGLGRVGRAAAGASTLIGAVPTNAFAALVLAARHGLQRVCVYGVPLIGVNSVSGFVKLQSVQVRTRLIQATEFRFSWTRPRVAYRRAAL